MRRKLLWGGALVLVLIYMGSAILERRAQRDSPRAQAEAVREEVRLAQAEAERCMEELAASNLRFQSQTRQTRAFQSRIEALEALDARGVPADSYDIYLDMIDRFNASIEGWEMRGEALERTQQSCRELIEARNVLADSLRRILVDMGYLPGEEEEAMPLPGGDSLADPGSPAGTDGLPGAEPPPGTEPPPDPDRDPPSQPGAS